MYYIMFTIQLVAYTAFTTPLAPHTLIPNTGSRFASNIYLVLRNVQYAAEVLYIAYKIMSTTDSDAPDVRRIPSVFYTVLKNIVSNS